MVKSFMPDSRFLFTSFNSLPIFLRVLLALLESELYMIKNVDNDKSNSSDIMNTVKFL